MQYIRHNFFKNFNNAIRYKDNELVKDLLTDELAKLCVFKKDDVAKALMVANIDLVKRPSPKYLSKKLAENINNPSVRKNIIKLIYENNKVNNIIPAKLSRDKINEYLTKITKIEVHNLNKQLFTNFSGGDLLASGEDLTNRVNTHLSNKNTINSQIRPIDTKRLLLVVAGIWIGGIALTHLMIWTFRKIEERKNMVNLDHEIASPEIPINENEQIGQINNDNIAEVGEIPEQNFPEPDLDIRINK